MMLKLAFFVNHVIIQCKFKLDQLASSKARC